MRSLLVTGAAGFIGSTLAREARSLGRLVLFDKLTYAGNKENITDLLSENDIHFVQGDIGDFDLVYKTLLDHKITDILNLAAESHVDNSISGPKPFIETNIEGTFQLLEASRKYWNTLPQNLKSSFRFLHVSTDEVFGELPSTGYFTEKTSYKPNSPYSASKAASDHLVRAWHHTYGLPTLVTNCSNNYGPRQYPEKLIPRMIDCALQLEPLPVYGKGENIRDWIHVEDHAQGILLTLEKGKVGETYCFGGRSERMNIDVVNTICKVLDKVKPLGANKMGPTGQPISAYADLIHFVTDRPGHDWRYAIDDTKAETELGFKRRYSSFEVGLEQTVKWYLDNSNWMNSVKNKSKK